MPGVHKSLQRMLKNRTAGFYDGAPLRLPPWLGVEAHLAPVGRNKGKYMEVLNIHERELDADAVQIGALIDTLASKKDRLWPKHIWPHMDFDRSLGVDAKGGHGPIRYFIEEYTPGISIKFRFTGPKGFNGFHGYEIVRCPKQKVVLRHTLKMNTYGPAILSWPLVYRPMHDALIEDSLATAQVSLGLSPKIHAWSLWVKILRWVVSGGKARSQVTPNNAFNTDAQKQRAG